MKYWEVPLAMSLIRVPVVTFYLYESGYCGAPLLYISQSSLNFKAWRNRYHCVTCSSKTSCMILKDYKFSWLMRSQKYAILKSNDCVHKTHHYYWSLLLITNDKIDMHVPVETISNKSCSDQNYFSDEARSVVFQENLTVLKLIPTF